MEHTTLEQKKGEKLMIVSIDIAKAFFIIKKLRKLGIKGSFFNMIKSIYFLETSHLIYSMMKD